jgi:hypothetical protein
MLRHVALVRTDISEVLSTTFIRVTRIGELGITLAVTSNRRTHGHEIILLFSYYPAIGPYHEPVESIRTLEPPLHTVSNIQLTVKSSYPVLSCG